MRAGHDDARTAQSPPAAARRIPRQRPGHRADGAAAGAPEGPGAPARVQRPEPHAGAPAGSWCHARPCRSAAGRHWGVP
ncbi:hypothetical protein E0686_15050 [Deinococcus sp. S9]|nr:hypothetical protein E0686_15050 [Deinococcus sp. S9]